MKADGSEVRRVLSVRDGSRDRIADVHPDGRRAAVTSDAGGANRPGILDLESGAVRWLGQEGVEEFAVEFSRDGRWLVTLRSRDASLSPVLYEVESGAERPVRIPPGMAMGAAFMLGDTQLLVHYSAADRRPEVLVYDLAQERYEAVLPAEYGSIDPAVFVADEHLRYPSPGGKMPAILLKPASIEPGERLPAVIEVQQGPTAQHWRTFAPLAQRLVDQGYVVLRPNPRGSTGYGVAWRDANL